MKQSKKEKLESKGWKVGSAAKFLGLSKKEAEFVQMNKLDLRLNESLDSLPIITRKDLQRTRKSN